MRMPDEVGLDSREKNYAEETDALSWRHFGKL